MLFPLEFPLKCNDEEKFLFLYNYWDQFLVLTSSWYIPSKIGGCKSQYMIGLRCHLYPCYFLSTRCGTCTHYCLVGKATIQKVWSTCALIFKLVVGKRKKRRWFATFSFMVSLSVYYIKSISGHLSYVFIFCYWFQLMCCDRICYSVILDNIASSSTLLLLHETERVLTRQIGSPFNLHLERTG